MIFVVLFFAFLIYFIYGQKQFSDRTEDAQDNIPTVTIDDTVETSDAPTNVTNTTSAPATDNQPSPTTIVSPVVAPTQSALLSRYNARSSDTLKLQ